MQRVRDDVLARIRSNAVNIDPAADGAHRLPELPRAARRRRREELVCSGCGLAYPVRDDIPVLLVDEARRPG